LRAEFGGNDIIQLSGSFDPPRVEQAISELKGEVLSLDTGALLMAISDGARNLPAILQGISATGADIHDTRLSEPNLESLFLKLTGKDLRA
jgi:ABC-2 type transport system ATP-binding protein